MSDDIFDMDSHQASQLKNQLNTKSSYNEYKLKEGKNYFFLLPPKKGSKQIVQTIEHQLWGAGKKLISSCVPPLKPEEGEDKIVKLAWQMKSKFENSRNDKAKNLFKVALPSKSLYANVIDLEPYLNANSKSEKKLSQVVRLPPSVAEYIFDAINESEDKYGNLTGVSHFEKGHYFIVGKSGTGLSTKYITKDSKEPAKLDSKFEIDKIELAKSMHDLNKLQRPFDPAKFEAHYKTMTAFFKKKMVEFGSDITAEDEDTDGDTESFESSEEFDLGLE